MNLVFLKKKKFYVPILIVILALGGYVYAGYNKSRELPEYEITPVMMRDLTQTVEATGRVESADHLSLRFEVGGTLAQISVKEGEKVKAGSLLAFLRLSDLEAAVAQARANLNQKIAGASAEMRNYYQAAVDAAKAAWDQSNIDTVNDITVKEAAKNTAQNNLELAEGGESSRLVINAYEDAVSLLFNSASVVDDALVQADNILGIDNSTANDTFESVLSIRDTNKLQIARIEYVAAKSARDVARIIVLNLTLINAHADIDVGIDAMLMALAGVNKLLSATADALTATITGTNFTQTDLQTKQSGIQTARGAAAASYTNLINQKQAIFDAKNSYATYNIAYNKAVRDWEDAKSTTVVAAASKEAAYNQALYNWQNQTMPAREVDLAYFRAALAQAVASRDKAILRAPIDGVITKVVKKRGEAISPSETVIEILSPHYEVNVDIPESDAPKIKLNDAVSMTLDAFGDDINFFGKIINVDLASTEIQDVVYYKVRVALNDTEQPIKPGMTANIAIGTAKIENTLVVPLRAVRTGDNGKYVRLLVNGQAVERPVSIGLKGDNGLAQIVDGLNEGDTVILSIKQK